MQNGGESKQPKQQEKPFDSFFRRSRQAGLPSQCSKLIERHTLISILHF
jgi:hypothetical protein